jgi:hypothetical protein
MILIDMGLNVAREYQTKKNEASTGFHYDAMSGENVITNVDKAAQTFGVGASIQFNYADGSSDVYTLGEDGKWRNSSGDYLFDGEDNKIYSSRGMA